MDTEENQLGTSLPTIYQLIEQYFKKNEEANASSVSEFTEPALHVQEEAFLPQDQGRSSIIPQGDEEGGDTCSMGSQSIHTSIHDMVSAFEEPESDEVQPCCNVRRDLEPILKAITEKHGDITKDCLLKSCCDRTSMMEAICTVIRDLQALPLTCLQEHHLECLKSTVADAENFKLNIGWLRNRFHELKEAVHLSSHCKNLENTLIGHKDLAEITKIALDTHQAEMSELESEIFALETQLEALRADEKYKKSILADAKSKVVPFMRNCLMDGLF